MVAINEVKLSLEYVNECLRYDCKTGKLFWKERPRHHFTSDRYHKHFNHVWAGKEAGNYDVKYIRIRLNYQKIAAHRIVWFINYGKWPKRFLDHINGNMKDNRLENLRESDDNKNQFNSKLHIDNTSGIKGVRPSTKQRWQAKITHQSKIIHLGSFATKEEAIVARIEAEKKYFGQHRKKYDFET